MCTVSGSPDAFNGWTNRETWATALHINNQQCWQQSVVDSLREALEANADLSAAEVGEIVRADVDETLDALGRYGGYEDFQLIRDDLGSLWRVDWQELGEAFLRDLRPTARPHLSVVAEEQTPPCRRAGQGACAGTSNGVTCWAHR